MKFKGVVLVHLGTPSDFTEGAARAFLKEFLGDPDVLRMPFLFRKFLAAKIAKARAANFAANLKRLAVDGEMQIAHYAGQLAAKLEAGLGVPVRHAGTYGLNGVSSAVESLKAECGNELLFIPLYPQYSSATTLPIIKKILRLGFSEKNIVRSYFDDPLYLEALVKSARKSGAKYEMLLGSFHAMPLDAPGIGDYIGECAQTLALLSKKLDVKSALAWQSVMERGKWTFPSVRDRVVGLIEEGVENLAVICPGFFCDCSETSLEIDVDLRKTFLESGGKSFVYINCLNDDDAHVRLLEKLCNDNRPD